jgi:4,5-dihydroxyphthalate decarboxylase
VANLQISLAVGNYDRTRAIFDGRAPIEGCDVAAVAIEPAEAFHRAYKFQEFDISEISLSSHAITTAQGNAPYVGIPAFLLRIFRHGGIYIRKDRGINRPEDLKGRTIGVPEYQLSANVWIRGMLQDEYGVSPKDIKWRSGGDEDPGRTERSPIKLPAGFDLQPIPSDRTLSDMLSKGEIDGIFGAREPLAMRRGDTNIVRLFPDYQKVEEAYFAKTRLFPVMHLLGIRRSLVERHPWLPVSVYKAFLKSKDLCMAAFGQIGYLSTSQPWSYVEHRRLQELMGADYWSYGVVENRHLLETFVRYSYEQGLSERPLRVEELFASSTMDMSRR